MILVGKEGGNSPVSSSSCWEAAVRGVASARSLGHQDPTGGSSRLEAWTFYPSLSESQHQKGIIVWGMKGVHPAKEVAACGGLVSPLSLGQDGTDGRPPNPLLLAAGCLVSIFVARTSVWELPFPSKCKDFLSLISSTSFTQEKGNFVNWK